MEPTAVIFMLLGLLQVITIGLTGWVLLKIVEILERLNKLEGKFDAFPIQQISNNRHRIENLERQITLVEAEVRGIKKTCAFIHKHHVPDEA